MLGVTLQLFMTNGKPVPYNIMTKLGKKTLENISNKIH